jgi:hypothetical protein
MKHLFNGLCRVCVKVLKVFGLQCQLCHDVQDQDHSLFQTSQEELLDFVVIRPIMFIR